MRIERTEPRRQSGVESYLRCGEYFRRTRILGERRQTTRMLVGSVVSEVAAHDTYEKLAGHRALTIRETIDLGLQAFQELQEEEPLSDPENSIRAALEVEGASRCFAVQISPIVKNPVLAEETWAVLVTPDDGGDPIHFQGTPDSVQLEGLGDYKAGKKWSPLDALKHRQIPFYAALHQAALGHLPKEAWIDNLFRIGKGKFGYQRLPVPVTRRSIDAALETLRTVVRAQEAGIYLPAANTDWFCTPKVCPLYGDCRYVGGTEDV